jgi:hypothetical protein
MGRRFPQFSLKRKTGRRTRRRTDAGPRELKNGEAENRQRDPQRSLLVLVSRPLPRSLALPRLLAQIRSPS